MHASAKKLLRLSRRKMCMINIWPSFKSDPSNQTIGSGDTKLFARPNQSVYHSICECIENRSAENTRSSRKGTDLLKILIVTHQGIWMDEYIGMSCAKMHKLRCKF